jgi:hypothetical protein
VSAEPRDRVAHARVRVRRLEFLGSADRPPVFHVFEEFYARSLHDVEEGGGGPPMEQGAAGAEGCSPFGSRLRLVQKPGRRRRKGGAG